MRKYIKLIMILFLFVSSILPASIPNVHAAPKKPIIICIDPGHQKKADNGKEPIAPGSRVMKTKVSSGTQGVVTNKPEYVLTLEVSLILKKLLEQRGYKVVMTRSTHDVRISNKQRAEIANQAHANLVVRIHADGSTLKSRNGISVLYPASIPSTAPITKLSNKAAQVILGQVTQTTGAMSRGAVPRSDLTGFNWSKVPTVVVEMGFMSNPEEDKKMATKAYQQKIAAGITRGIETYFKK